MKKEIQKPLAADGWPVSGMAQIDEVCAASSLSRSKVYSMLTSGELPSVRFGRSRRVSWATVRRMFLVDCDQ